MAMGRGIGRLGTIARAVGLRPAFDVSFLGGQLPPGLTHTRSSNATRFNEAGQIEWAPMNAVVNSVAAGPQGAQPTGWPSSFAPGGVAISYSSGVDAITGLPFVDVRFAGTTTGAGGVGVNFLGSPVAGRAGQRWSGSSWVALAAGSVPPATAPLGVEVLERLAGAGNGSTSTPFAPTASLVRYGHTHPVTNATTDGILLSVRMQVASGVAMDFTLRVAGPQLELGSVVREYRPTTSAAYYAPRFESDPSTLAPLGLLIEGQSTNLIPQSEKTNGTVGGTVAAAADYFGWRMTRYTADASGNAHGFIYDPPAAAPAANSKVTLSTVVRHISGTPYLQLTGSGSWVATPITDAYINFDIVSGVVMAVGAQASNPSIQPLGGGYFRIAGTFNTSASPSSATALVCFSLLAGTETRAPPLTLAQVVDFGLGQHEASSTLTSYIPTYGSAATRAADTLTGPTTWLNPNQGTMLAEWVRLAIPTNSLSYNPCVAILRNSAITRLAILCGSSSPSQQRFDVVDGNVNQAALGATGVAGQVYKFAASWQQDLFRGAQNGVNLTADTAGTIPQGVTTLELGNYGPSSPLNGHLRRFAYWPVPMASAQLQPLSA